MEPKFRVTVTARQFFYDPAIRTLCDDYGFEIDEAGYGGEIEDARIGTTELLQMAQSSDALIVGKAHVNCEAISGLPRLKVISVRGVGYDGIDVAAASERGVTVTITPGCVDDAVAEYTLGLMIAVARGVLRADEHLRAGRWTVVVGSELKAKTLGIVGLGGVGRAVARRASLGFGMRVLAHTRHPDSRAAADVGVELASLETLVSRSDFITLHLPLSEATRGLIGPREFGLMKKSVYLINTARGAIVDEAALYEALSTKRIAGAALDVFSDEPLRGSPLLSLDNVILTPHMAGYTDASIIRANRAALHNALCVLQGLPIKLGVVVNCPGAAPRP